ncbi:hypothetical protein C8R43DRAFT_951417 [Mycena crocata]|nr:hypothetical protein C8R43DRAFT_951417 [Mycena crocata]
MYRLHIPDFGNGWMIPASSAVVKTLRWPTAQSHTVTDAREIDSRSDRSARTRENSQLFPSDVCGREPDESNVVLRSIAREVAAHLAPAYIDQSAVSQAFSRFFVFSYAEYGTPVKHESDFNKIHRRNETTSNAATRDKQKIKPAPTATRVAQQLCDSTHSSSATSIVMPRHTMWATMSGLLSPGHNATRCRGSRRDKLRIADWSTSAGWRWQGFGMSDGTRVAAERQDFHRYKSEMLRRTLFSKPDIASHVRLKSMLSIVGAADGGQISVVHQVAARDSDKHNLWPFLIIIGRNTGQPGQWRKAELEGGKKSFRVEVTGACNVPASLQELVRGLVCL